MSHKRTTARRQSFFLTAPGAVSVLLAGDFTQWQQQATPMKTKGGGLWTTTIELAPGTYHYRFIVDGQWRDDPDCTLRVANPYNSEDSVREVT